MANQSDNVNVNINFQTNAGQATQQVNNLGGAIQNTTTSTQNMTQATDTMSKSLATNGKAVLDNGGAMGLLNTVTGGYAQIVKDAVEASQLFTSAKKADTAAIAGNVVATEAATVATNTWTASLLANPFVAIAAAVIALGAAVYLLTKYFNDNAEAARKVTAAVNQTKISNDAYNKSLSEGKTLRDQTNSLEIARAKSLGATEEAIDKLIEKQKKLDEQLSFSAAKEARRRQIEAQDRLRDAMRNGDKEAIKAGEESLKEATDAYTKLNEEYNQAIVAAATQTYDIQAKAVTKARDKAEKSQEEADKKRLEKEKKRLDEVTKLRLDAFNKEIELTKASDAVIDKLRSQTETPAQKENREYAESKAILEANNQATEDLTRQHMVNLAKIAQEERDKELAKVDEFNAINRERRFKNKETRVIEMQDSFDKERAFVQLGVDAEIAEEEARFGKLTEEQQRNEDQIALHEANKSNILAKGKSDRDKIRDAENIATMDTVNQGINAISALAEAFKAGDNASVKQKKKSIKREVGVKIAGIAGDTATGIMKGFADLPTPAAWVNTAIVGALGIASTVSAVKSGQKQLAALGEGGSVEGGDASAVPASAAPTTSFIASSNNQLANSIAGVQGDKPIKTYVTIGDVNTAQELDRKAADTGVIG